MLWALTTRNEIQLRLQPGNRRKLGKNVVELASAALNTQQRSTAQIAHLFFLRAEWSRFCFLGERVFTAHFQHLRELLFSFEEFNTASGSLPAETMMCDDVRMELLNEIFYELLN